MTHAPGQSEILAMWDRLHSSSELVTTDVRFTRRAVLRCIDSADRALDVRLLDAQQRIAAMLPAGTLVAPRAWWPAPMGTIAMYERLAEVDSFDASAFTALGRSLRALHDVELDELDADDCSALRENATRFNRKDEEVANSSLREMADTLEHFHLPCPNVKWLKGDVVNHGDLHLRNHIDGQMIDLDTIHIGPRLMDLWSVITDICVDMHDEMDANTRDAAFGFPIEKSLRAFILGYTTAL